MNCVSCDICVYLLGLCVFFPGVFLSSRVTGACPVTTDLIMRVNVRTTTTTTVTHLPLETLSGSKLLEVGTGRDLGTQEGLGKCPHILGHCGDQKHENTF